MGMFDFLLSDEGQASGLDLQKKKLAMQNLLAQQSAQSQLGLVPDPSTGQMYDAPTPPTQGPAPVPGSMNSAGQRYAQVTAPGIIGKNLLSGGDYDNANSNLLRQAFPDAASAAMTAKMGPQTFMPLKEGESPGVYNPATGTWSPSLDASGNPIATNTKPTDAMKNIKALAAMGPNDPGRPLLQSIVDHEAGMVTDPIEKDLKKAQTAAASNSDLVESKDAFGNPIVINKRTGAVTKPDGVQNVTEDDVESTAKMIANYDKKPPSGASAMRPFSLAVMDRVSKINPDYDEKFYNSANAARTKFSSGKEGTLVRSANVATSHLQTLDALGQALDNGNIQLANTLRNKLSAEFGGVPITSYQTAAPLVGDEVAKFILGGNSAVSDREKFAAPLTSSASGPQRAANINTFKGLMVGQLHGLKRQYETETRSKDFGSKLDPQVAALLDNPQYAPGTNPNTPPPARTPPPPPAGAKHIQNGWYYDSTGKPLAPVPQ